jgi:hypothetical protein
MLTRAIRLFESLALLEVFLSEDFNVETFLKKLKSVVTLARRGATEGERSASRGALERLMSRAKDEAKAMSSGDATRFLARMQAIADGVNATTEPPAEPRRPRRPRPPPEPPKPQKPERRFNVGTWVYCTASGTDFGRVGQVDRIIRIDKDRNVPRMHVIETDSRPWWAPYSKLRRATKKEVDAELSARSKRASELGSLSKG